MQHQGGFRNLPSFTTFIPDTPSANPSRGWSLWLSCWKWQIWCSPWTASVPRLQRHLGNNNTKGAGSNLPGLKNQRKNGPSFFFCWENWRYMDVSENTDTPKSSICFKGFSTLNHRFWEFSPYFWKILKHGNSEDISIFCCAIFSWRCWFEVNRFPVGLFWEDFSEIQNLDSRRHEKIHTCVISRSL